MRNKRTGAKKKELQKWLMKRYS